MADISSNLPVRGATGDLLVSIFDYAGATFNPATKELQASILAGITAQQPDISGILAGVTGIEAINTNILAGVTSLEASNSAILDGVTGLEATSANILAGVTGIEAINTNILAGVTSLEASNAAILAGVTGLDATAVQILNGVTGLEATSVDILAGITAINGTQAAILAGVTGIQAQLPAVIGVTLAAASLSVAIASDQEPVPVYITSGAASAPVVQFNNGSGVAYLSGITGVYAPADPFVLNQVYASGSGRIKVEVYAGLIADWDYDVTRLKWVAFNSTSNPNVYIDCSDFKLTASTEKVEVVVTNYENGRAQDLYCTIVGDLI